MNKEPTFGPEETIMVTSIYGAKTGLGLVEVAFRGETIHIRPEEARDLAANLLGCAEAADTDEYLMSWLRTISKNDVAAAQVLRNFREWRDARRKAPPA